MILKIGDDFKKKFWEYVSYEECINLYIIADVESYGFETEFLNVWMQVDDENNACSIILRYYSTLIVYSYKNDFDVDELIQHIESLDIDAINGKKSVIDRLCTKFNNYKDKKECYFCSLTKLNDLSFDDSKDFKIEEAGVKDLEDVFKLLKKNEDFKLENYIQSKSRQIKTKSGRVYFIKKDNKVISTCGTGIENSFLAMINGVATEENYRNKGLATYLVYTLSKKLLEEEKYPCLFYHNKDAGKIYYKIGYKPEDNWVMLFK